MPRHILITLLSLMLLPFTANAADYCSISEFTPDPDDEARLDSGSVGDWNRSFQRFYIDVDDIADVAVAAFTEDTHNGEIYEVTGPRLMTIADVAAELSRATGREINYVDVPHEAFVSEVANSGAPKDVVWMLDYLFSTVLDGRNAYLTDGVQRALGRPPIDFADYANEAAKSGIWKNAA